MTTIDPVKERERLKARYEAMSDLELQKVGKDPVALTEWARAALVEEMKRRRMEWKLERRTAKTIAEDEILIRLRGYADRNSAGLDRDYLAGAGIKAYFCEEEAPPADNETAAVKAEGGTQLLVRAKDLISARQQLTERDDAEAMAKDQPEENVGLDRPVVLRRYRDMPAAFVEKSMLENAGIECFLQDDNVVRMDWLWSNAMGGIKLLVREKDVNDAETILRGHEPAAGPGSDEGLTS